MELTGLRQCRLRIARQRGIVPSRSTSRVRVMAVGTNSPRPRGSARESLNLLEAFFVGRAFAEVVNERLGEWAADIFAELGKLEAEIRRAQSEFEEEVMQRAQSEMRASAGGSGEISSRYQTDDEDSSDVTSRGLRIAHSGPADMDEAVDNLRAEIAAARAALQALKRRLRTEENRKLET